MWFESRRNNERHDRWGKPSRRAGSRAEVFTFSAAGPPRAAKWSLTAVLFRRGYPIDGETTPVAEEASGERSSVGTSRI